MKMIPVSSSAILAIGYDPAALLMKIKFAEGFVYDFCGVPQEIFTGLLNAKSKGSYYNSHIRDRYPC